jgi:serine/threonine protein phosphatase 1
MSEKEAPLFAIGDIHGCAPELHRLIAELPLTADSTIVFLGDMVDRGNYSREVIDTILDLSKKYKVVALCGNHEDMMIEFLSQNKSPEAASFIMNGGSSTLASYSDDFGKYVIPEEHMRFLNELKLYYETEKFFFVHAGVPEIPLSQLNPNFHRPVFLWTRNPFISSSFDWGKVIVHGHTPVDRPDIRPNRINIDTGCFYDGRLTAIEVHSGVIFSVEKDRKNEARIYLRDSSSTRVATRFDGQISVGITKNGTEQAFVTENYSEFGLLIRAADGSKKRVLFAGEQINGRVGNDEHRKVFFEGEVMRVEDRGNEFLYGIRIAKAISADEGS